ncbi:MAG: hypothetical protein A2958_01800 [Candidatus Levybacteria bacterium RIFCSPLOWO2_01_FULL_38_13]|nr:MAG: hypothetical protein A2629_01270 [Candidatus Levybacteria bacterium RIFCSPHIGHO2_01_FULL_41_15]OGH34678.1 MAG: hypothetical protein A2958_01800 [Candidatus Levybacteria bacterium RIFCSPLOWO2_01_FULL_38_13]
MPDIFIANSKVKTQTHIDKKSDGIRKINRLHLRFTRDPEKITFQHQKQDEKIILLLRRHFITNLSWLLISAVLIIAFPIFISVSNDFANLFPFLPNGLLFFSALFYYLIILSYILISFMDWFYNITLITDRGVVDIDYSNIVYHDVAMTNLNLIEDVNYTKVGFIRSLLNYGDLFVQTAGGKENLEALAVPNPAEAARIIGESIGKGGTSG